MATEEKISQDSPSSSDTQIPKEAHEYEEVKTSASPPADAAKDQDHIAINYPPPWKWEKYFVGGYSQGRMFKFKKPKTMYTAINLFAGVAIMFYGYDQGVMSQVNLNEDYWNHSEGTPIVKTRKELTPAQWVSILQRIIPEMLLPRAELSLSTTVVHSSELLLPDR